MALGALEHRHISASPIRVIAEYGMRKPDVVALWFGESDITTPEFVRAAAQESLARGETFYAPNAGIDELRTELAAYQRGLYGPSIAPENIVVTNSGMTGLMIAFQLCLLPGDNIIVVEPVWPNLLAAPGLVGADVTPFAIQKKSSRYVLDIDALFSAVTAKTKAIAINTPNNPTGWFLEHDEIAGIVSRARNLGLWIIADEVYARVVLPGGHAPSFVSHLDRYDRIVVVNSFSKAWAMTGWRLGWLTLAKGAALEAIKLVEYNFSCSPVFIQRAGICAIREGEGFISESVERFGRSLACATETLSRYSFLSFVEPKATFYLFVRVDGLQDGVRAAKDLIDHAGVGLAPGEAFGRSGQGFLRLCFGVSPQRMDVAMKRLDAALTRKGQALFA